MISALLWTGRLRNFCQLADEILKKDNIEEGACFFLDVIIE